MSGKQKILNSQEKVQVPDGLLSVHNVLKVSLRIERKYICDGKEVSSSSVLSVGDKVTVCITVSADRDMDFVRIKDEKPSCLEVASQLSSYSWAEGLSFYRVNKDASVEFFIDRMRKGSYTIRYDAYVARSGKYVSGPVSVISVYAPQFGSHGESSVITIHGRAEISTRSCRVLHTPVWR